MWAAAVPVDQLYNKALVWNVADFYELTKEHLLTLEGWKERSAERFLKSLDDSRKVPFERVLYALGIRYVGETTAKSLAKNFGSIDALAKATIEELLATDDIGQVIAESVYDFFREDANIDTIVRLKAAGLKFEAETSQQKLSEKLAGKTIVISGNFSVSRDDMKALIAAHGGKNSGSVSGKTSYLLAGEKPGPEKIKKAESLGVEIIDEQKFREMIAI